MAEKISELFGEDVAKRLGAAMKAVYPHFDQNGFTAAVADRVQDKTYTERIMIISDELHSQLPHNFSEAWEILKAVLGPENTEQTGMFKHWYWLMPVAKYIERFGLDDPKTALDAIEEVTKRNTGEYAIRPYIRKYPDITLARMNEWSRSSNFHLRRLASEGLRPKLPWASKLETFIDTPEPVFAILENLKEDEILFVKKSVANHLTDWLKVNPPSARELITRWSMSENLHTQWIIRRATRKVT